MGAFYDLVTSYKHSSLRNQFILVIMIMLLIPVLVMLYDIFYASKSDEAMIKDREDRLGTIVQTHIVPHVTMMLENSLQGQDIMGLETENRVTHLRKAFNTAAEPLVEIYPGVRIGLYIPENQQIFVHGFLHEYRQRSEEEAQQREKRILNEADTGLLAVAASKQPISRLTSSLNDQTFEYLAPVIIDDHLVAVAWADERLHPIFAQSRNFRLITRYVTLSVFLICATGTLILIHNFTRSVSKIKEGLAILENDIHHQLPDMSGEAGQIVAAINTMATSVAEKERLEEELRRSERLASLGRLVTGVAHELRNPIGIVKATVQVMENEFKNNQSMAEYSNVIKEQVDRQNHVIQELLDFGRPSKHMLQDVNLNSLLKKVLTFTTPMLRQHKINLNLLLSPDLPPVRVDGERIKQVYVNLIINAIQAMNDGGNMVISTYTDHNRVKISFEDSGAGMSQEEIHNVFEPFYSTKENGTGLGLSISYQIVKNHGGTIEVSSEPSRGTIFTVNLPMSDDNEGDEAHDT